MATKRTQVLWSGGIESTALLKHFLLETDDEVVAHFVRLVTPERNHHMAELAVQRLRPYLEAIRPFEYVMSEVSIAFGTTLPPDYQTLYFVGYQLHGHYDMDRMYRALCVEDFIRTPRLRHESPDHRFNNQRGCIAGMLHDGQNLSDMVPWHPMFRWYKFRHMQYLGELWPMTWSCRRPKLDQPCGECHSCKERAYAKWELDQL